MAKPKPTIIGSAMSTVHKDLMEHPKVKGQWGKTERIVLLQSLEARHGKERLLRLLNHEKIDAAMLPDTLRSMRDRKFTPEVMDGFIEALDHKGITPESVPHHAKNYLDWGRATRMGTQAPKPWWKFWGK